MPWGQFKKKKADGTEMIHTWMSKVSPFHKEHLLEKESPKEETTIDPNKPRTFWVVGNLGDNFGIGQSLCQEDYPLFGTGWIKCVEVKEESVGKKE